MSSLIRKSAIGKTEGLCWAVPRAQGHVGFKWIPAHVGTLWKPGAVCVQG